MAMKLQSQLLEKFPPTSNKTSSTVNKNLFLGGHTSTQLNVSSVLLNGLMKSTTNSGRSLTDSGEAKRRRLENKAEQPSRYIFNEKVFVVEFNSTASYTEKAKVRGEIKDAGGVISHMLTNKVYAVVVTDNKCLESYKCKKAETLSIPVVSYQYIKDSVDRGVCEDVDGYRLLGLTRTGQLQTGKILDTSQGKVKRMAPPSSVDWNSFPPCSEDGDVEYMQQPDGYSVPKWAFLSTKTEGLRVVEIHVIELKDKKQFKVATLHYATQHAPAGVTAEIEVRQVEGALQAELLFASLHSYYESTLGCKKLDSVPFARGSPRLCQNLFPWAISSESVSDTVRQVVDMIWNEAVGEVERNLTMNVRSLSRAVVEQAEGILAEMKDNLKAGKDNSQLQEEFYSTLPFKSGRRSDLCSLKAISAQFNMIQLLYDLLSVGEATDWNLKATTQTKLKSLNCHLAEQEIDNQLAELLADTCSSGDDVIIEHVYAVTRPTEHLVHDGKERQLLFHASNPENYLGILSRGLLMPKHVVDDFGGKRTDAGNLGNGIYFADEFRTSNGYTRSFTGNGRLMLVCEVVTGKQYCTTEKMADLVEPPSGYDSVKAEKATEGVNSQFKSNEYCVYSKKQQVLKYVIQYTTSEDRLDQTLPELYSLGVSVEHDVPEQGQITTSPVVDDITGIELDQVLPGLQVDGDSKVPIPLQRIHVTGKIADLTAEVTVFQQYKNVGSEPLETKFVFPLTEMAAVCGFEAYINGKHIVGEVKEKETAQREYRQAVNEGHGAYLMVQDKERPDVFTVSVGNLPPHCIALIKITYICELAVKEEKLVFELPNSLAPWNVDQALAETTQSKTESVGLDPKWLDNIKCGVHLSLQMPFEIRQIDCPTHDVNIKRTDLLAMVEMKEGQSLADGFTLNVSLAEIHVPRMIIENHPDEPEDKQACMLTFYPEFECEAQDNYELVIMLDMSNSMSADDITSSKKITLILLNSLNKHVFFNVIVFGSTYSELFLKSMPATKVNIKQAVSYIQACTSRHGNTDLLTPLTNLSMLADTCRHRNVVVISDGHMTHARVTMQAVTGMYGALRLFTLAVSKEANKFMMRELARLGSGAMEYMNPSAKSKWLTQIRGVVEKAAQPLLSQVKVVWQEQNVDLEAPLQAPVCIPSVFNGSRVVVYGFASNCYMATLKAVISGREVSTVVSVSPLSCQTGLTVHRLAARAVIQDWEHGCLSDDSVEHLALKKKRKSSIIKMSMEYSIITQFTSFVAVEKREKNEAFTGNDPDIDELVDDIDLLPYMEYESSIHSEHGSSSYESFDGDEHEDEVYDEDCMETDYAEPWSTEYDDVVYGAPDSSHSDLSIDEDVLEHDSAGGKMETDIAEAMSDDLGLKRAVHFGRNSRGFARSAMDYRADSAPQADSFASQSLASVKSARRMPLSMQVMSSQPAHDMPATSSFFARSQTPSAKPTHVVADTSLFAAASRPDKSSKAREVSLAPALTATYGDWSGAPQQRTESVFGGTPTGWGRPKEMYEEKIYDGAMYDSVSAPKRYASMQSYHGYSFGREVAQSNRSAKSSWDALPPTPSSSTLFGAAPPPPPGRPAAFGAAPPPPPVQSTAFGAAPPPPPGRPAAFGAAPPPPPVQSAAFGAAPPPPPGRPAAFEAAPPPPPVQSAAFGAAPPLPARAATFGAAPPPPPVQSTAFGAAPPPPPVQSTAFVAAPATGFVMSDAPQMFSAARLVRHTKCSALPPASAANDSQTRPRVARHYPPSGVSMAEPVPAPRRLLEHRLDERRSTQETDDLFQDYRRLEMMGRSAVAHGRDRSNLVEETASKVEVMLKTAEAPEHMQKIDGVPMTEQREELAQKLKKLSAQSRSQGVKLKELTPQSEELSAQSRSFKMSRKKRAKSYLREQSRDRSAASSYTSPSPESRASMASQVSVDSYQSKDDMEMKSGEFSQPGIYVRLPGAGRTLLVDYGTLKDFPWKESLHVITSDPQPADYVRQLFDESAEDPIQLKSFIQSCSDVIKGFCYSALEKVLIDSGIQSLGKTAAKEILGVFFFKFALVAMLLEKLSELYDGEAFDTQKLVQLLDSNDEQKVWELLDVQQADMVGDHREYLLGLFKKHRDVLGQLELGRRWSTVVINMVCSADKHQVDFLIDD